MLKNLTYKNKFRLLIAAMVVIGLIVFKISILKTIHIKKECNKISQQLNAVDNLPFQISSLKKKLDELDKQIGNNKDAKDNGRTMIINICGNYCKKNNIRLLKINEPVSRTADELKIITHELVFKASFKKLLHLLHELENTNLPAKIASATFEKQIDKRTKQESLNLKIYLQSILKIFNDEKQ